MILSGGEQRDSALHIHVSILPWFILKMLFMMSKNSTQIFIKYTPVCWVMTPTPPKKKKKDVHTLISGTVSTLPFRAKGTLQILFNYKP